MPVISVRIPQMGEGLQEARLVSFLKKPGDSVKRDEPLYQMETDKAVMDVESPYEGKLVSWLADVDAVLPIGSPVAEMDVADGVREMEVHGAPSKSTTQGQQAAAAKGTASARNAVIPPRTKAYAKEKGLSEDDLSSIVTEGGKVMPADVDAFLSRGPSAQEPAARASTTGAGGKFTERAMTQKQRVLSSRLVRSTQLVVPGTISVVVNWESIESLRQEYKKRAGDFQPSTFTMAAFAVAKAMSAFPAFRSTLRGDGTIRTYEHANLGIAVALPGDELVTAVVEGADALSWKNFAQKARERIELARNGTDQANESVTLSITNMQIYGLRDAVPVLVAPSVGVLFLGEVYNGLDNETPGELKVRRLANLTLTFDHRLINGVGAADFLNAIKANIDAIKALIGDL